MKKLAGIVGVALVAGGAPVHADTPEVAIDGSTIADRIAHAAGEATSQGDFVKRVAALAIEWSRAGLIATNQRGHLISAAAAAGLH